LDQFPQNVIWKALNSEEEQTRSHADMVSQVTLLKRHRKNTANLIL